jgi:hypothetical protein
MTKKKRLSMTRNEELAMTGKIVSGFMRVTLDSDAHCGGKEIFVSQKFLV